MTVVVCFKIEMSKVSCNLAREANAESSPATPESTAALLFFATSGAACPVNSFRLDGAGRGTAGIAATARGGGGNVNTGTCIPGTIKCGATALWYVPFVRLVFACVAA